MTTVKDMMNTSPSDLGDIDREALARCIQECDQCAQTCTACADACLAEERVEELLSCIRLDLDCADVCDITGRLLSRITGSRPDIAIAQLQTCAVACDACATECEQHAREHEHCRLCAEACRSCERACRQLLSAGM